MLLSDRNLYEQTGLGNIKVDGSMIRLHWYVKSFIMHIGTGRNLREFEEGATNQWSNLLTPQHSAITELF